MSFRESDVNRKRDGRFGNKVGSPPEKASMLNDVVGQQDRRAADLAMRAARFINLPGSSLGKPRN